MSDLRAPWAGWRDLGRTQRRLARGDEFLGLTYLNSAPAHHVDEGLSELTYYMYEARRAPLSALRATVRERGGAEISEREGGPR